MQRSITSKPDQASSRRGFTIVELLIVIVIIAILTAITIVAYNGIQGRAQQAKIQNDLTELEQAILAARIQTGETVWQITGGPGITGDACAQYASGTDIAAIPKSDSCWTKNADALSKISIASGINVRNLLDPWQRPYWIYENEGRLTPTDCHKDYISNLRMPHVLWGQDDLNLRDVPNSLQGC